MKDPPFFVLQEKEASALNGVWIADHWRYCYPREVFTSRVQGFHLLALAGLEVAYHARITICIQ